LLFKKIFFFCGEKVQNQELSGVYLTNSGTAQNQEKSGVAWQTELNIFVKTGTCATQIFLDIGKY